MKLYQIWTVYENGAVGRYYIINQDTKQVQSTWKDYLEAKGVCDTLNDMDKKHKEA